MFCQLWNTLSPQYLTRQIDPFLLLKQWSNLVPQYNVDYSTWWKTHLESSGTLSCSYLLSFLCNEIRRHLNFKRTTVHIVRTLSKSFLVKKCGNLYCRISDAYFVPITVTFFTFFISECACALFLEVYSVTIRYTRCPDVGAQKRGAGEIRHPISSTSYKKRPYPYYYEISLFRLQTGPILYKQ